MSVSSRTSSAIALGLIILLAACSTPDGRFPSLERRAAEMQAPVTETISPVAPTALPDALASQVKALVKRHERANSSFAAGLPAMRTTAANAAGTSAGSETWVNAHLQLSRLGKLRADSVAALGELDTLIAEQIVADSNYVTLLLGLQESIAAEVSAQRDEIDRMSRQIGE